MLAVKSTYRDGETIQDDEGVQQSVSSETAQPLPQVQQGALACTGHPPAARRAVPRALPSPAP